MGASNVKSLKLLGASKRKPFFRFHNQESTQNLFLKYDVQLKSEHLGNQLPVIAKWDHILKLFELDKPRPFRQLYNDRHQPEPHWTERYESELGCRGNEPYSCSKPQHSSGCT
jgi:hypothetical protein